MNVELAPCYLDVDLFLRMSKEYVEELRQYDNTIPWVEQEWKAAAWESSFFIEDRKIQGFAFIQHVKFEVFGDALYIGEFYVEPEARRRGLGFEAIKLLTREWHGDVFLYILDQNKKARFFWTAVEGQLGWKRIQRPEIREEKGCELRVYQTK